MLVFASEANHKMTVLCKVQSGEMKSLSLLPLCWKHQKLFQYQTWQIAPNNGIFINKTGCRWLHNSVNIKSNHLFTLNWVNCMVCESHHTNSIKLSIHGKHEKLQYSTQVSYFFIFWWFPECIHFVMTDQPTQWRPVYHLYVYYCQ